MSDVTLSYKGSDILELSDSGSATLKTGGTYCEDDIELEYVKPSGGGLGAYQLLNTITVEDGVSSVVITLPSGYTEYGLYIDALTTSASAKKYFYHTSVAQSRLFGESNTANTFTCAIKIKAENTDPLGEHDYNVQRLFSSGNSNYIPTVIMYGIPQSILITRGGTFTGGTIEVYGR